MAEKVYRASTTAPVNIAVVKYAPSPDAALSPDAQLTNRIAGTGESAIPSSTSQPTAHSQ